MNFHVNFSIVHLCLKSVCVHIHAVRGYFISNHFYNVLRKNNLLNILAKLNKFIYGFWANFLYHDH